MVCLCGLASRKPFFATFSYFFCMFFPFNQKHSPSSLAQRFVVSSQCPIQTGLGDGRLICFAPCRPPVPKWKKKTTVLSKHEGAKPATVPDFMHLLRWDCQLGFWVAGHFGQCQKWPWICIFFGFCRPISWRVILAFVLGMMPNSVSGVSADATG